MFEYRDKFKDKVYKIEFDGSKIILTKAPDYPIPLKEYQNGHYDLKFNDLVIKYAYIADIEEPFISTVPAMIGMDGNQYILFDEGTLFTKVMLTKDFLKEGNIFDVILM